MSLDRHYPEIASLMINDKEQFLKTVCATKQGLQFFQLATVFQQIHADEKNEDIILTFLNNMDNSLINKTMIGIDASLLLIAVRKLKLRVVETLLKKGADIHYQNSTGESISTNWDMQLVEQKQQTTIKLIKLLHSNGVDLSRDTPKYFSIINAIYENPVQLTSLIQCIENLGYHYTIPGDWDFDEDNQED